VITGFEQAMHFSINEKLALISAPWDRMADHPEDIPVPDWQLKELERRGESYPVASSLLALSPPKVSLTLRASVAWPYASPDGDVRIGSSSRQPLASRRLCH
jgi:putative addiction module component (TIGR02574 family)